MIRLNKSEDGKKTNNKHKNGNEHYLEKFDNCKTWLLTLKKSKATYRKYSSDLTILCRHFNITPDEIIKLPHDKIQKLFEEYVIHLTEIAVNEVSKACPGRLSVNSVWQYAAGIKSFLDYHAIPLAWKKIKALFPEELPTELRAYTQEEISALLEHSKDEREMCMILIQCSAGARVGGGISLTLGKIFPIISDEAKGSILQVGDLNNTGTAMMMVYGKSKRSIYPAFITPECRDAINKYLEFRRNQGEQLTSQSPLIRDNFKMFSPRTNRPRFVSEGNVNRIIKKIAKRGNIDLHDIAPNHGLREFYYSAITNSEIADEFKDLLMGYKRGTGPRYYYELIKSKTNQQKLLSEYLKALDELTIGEKFKLTKQLAKYEEAKKINPPYKCYNR